MTLCECGCGQEVNEGRRYIQYHQLRGKHLSEEQKRKISESNKGKIFSEEAKRKMSESHKGKVFSKKHKKNLSLAAMGHSVSKETRQKLSLIQKGKISNSKYSKRSYYLSPYQKVISFRSSYEKAYAEFLDANNMDWLYEPCTFDLGDTTYLPDFYLIKYNVFIEIKGWMSEKAQNKIDAFKKIYPEEEIVILFKEDLEWLGVL